MRRSLFRCRPMRDVPLRATIQANNAFDVASPSSSSLIVFCCCLSCNFHCHITASASTPAKATAPAVDIGATRPLQSLVSTVARLRTHSGWIQCCQSETVWFDRCDVIFGRPLTSETSVCTLHAFTVLAHVSECGSSRHSRTRCFTLTTHGRTGGPGLVLL